jgi:transposase InsO family protein
MLTCYDDYSHQVHIQLLQSKLAAPQALINYIKLSNNQLSTSLKILRTNQGGEFSSTELAQTMADLGAQHIHTPTDAHMQNGRVE